MRGLCRVATLGVVWWALTIPVGAEQEFRVESKVFVGAETEAKAENTTLFLQGWIYDFLEKPPEITILNKSRTKFFLIDPTRRVKAEVSAEMVAATSAELKRKAAAKTEAFTRFLADPRFDEQRDARNRRVFDSPWLTYRVAAKPAAGEEIVTQFYEFSDWFTKLNACLDPAYRQVFVRLAVNESLRNRKELPHEIELTYHSPKGRQQKVTARSTHVYTSRLDESDRDRVQQADQFVDIFPTVSLAEYRKRQVGK